MTNNSKHLNRICFEAANVLLSVLFSCAIVIGGKFHLEDEYNIPFKVQDIWPIFGIFLLTYAGLHLLYYTLPKVSIAFKQRENMSRKSRQLWLAGFILLLILWLPYYLTYYPGNLTNDSYATLAQILEIETLKNHHPVMFTLMVGFFFRIGTTFGDVTLGVAFFSVAQMVILAAVLSYSVSWLYKKGAPHWLIGLVTVFWGLNPVIANYSITMWKDVLFGAWMLLMLLYLIDTIDEKGKNLEQIKGLCQLGILSFLVSFGRNNGFIVIAALLVILCITFRKNRRLWISAVLIIGSVYWIQHAGYAMAGVVSGNKAESLSIPIQQIARTVFDDGEINEEQLAFIDQILPLEDIRERYHAISPDDLKFHENFDNEFLESHMTEFLKVWAQLLPKNLESYMKAYIAQTSGKLYESLYCTDHRILAYWYDKLGR